MKRCYSLKKNRDFQFTYRVGKSVGCRLFSLCYVHDRRKNTKSRRQVITPVPNVRVGFSVSKKVGNSVCRNRAKRRLRAAFSPYIAFVKPGHNIIVIARPAVLDEPFASLSRSAYGMLFKAGLLADEECKP